jgi:hypothetical protein
MLQLERWRLRTIVIQRDLQLIDFSIDRAAYRHLEEELIGAPSDGPAAPGCPLVNLGQLDFDVSARDIGRHDHG